MTTAIDSVVFNLQTYIYINRPEWCLMSRLIKLCDAKHLLYRLKGVLVVVVNCGAWWADSIARWQQTTQPTIVVAN